MSDSNCIFCQIIDGKTDTQFIYTDPKLVVFKDINPKADIHLLVVPRLHIKSLAEATTDDSELLIHMLYILPKLAKEQGLAGGFRTVINTGRQGGQIVDHIHFHLLAGGKLPGF